MRLGRNVCDAISHFTFALIAGELGRDDSSYSRDRLFLKQAGIASQAMSVFLYWLEIDDAGNVVNHDKAEDRVSQYIRWKNLGDEPNIPFTEEELGIREL
jgi:hypothetical protein